MKHSEHLSPLPAMTVDVYLAHCVFRGTTNAGPVLDFLRYQVLPRCTPGYRILLIDNALIIDHQRLYNSAKTSTCI